MSHDLERSNGVLNIFTILQQNIPRRTCLIKTRLKIHFIYYLSWASFISPAYLYLLEDQVKSPSVNAYCRLSCTKPFLHVKSHLKRDLISPLLFHAVFEGITENGGQWSLQAIYTTGKCLTHDQVIYCYM